MTSRVPEKKAGFKTSGLLTDAGFRHAFFTRNGGVSGGPYASLNFSIGVGDEERYVDENFDRAAEALGVEGARVLFLSQVHGRIARHVETGASRRDVSLLEGDAIVGSDPSAAFGVRTADCVPILIGDRRSGAVAAVHAGWRGLVANVIEAGITELRRVAGGPIDPVAAIGPHIGVRAFEVSEDVASALARLAPNETVIDGWRGPKPHVDLSLVARAELVSAGVSADAVDRVSGCTFDDDANFFSFRRDGAKSGRHLASVVPRRSTR